MGNIPFSASMMHMFSFYHKAIIGCSLAWIYCKPMLMKSSIFYIYGVPNIAIIYQI